jgi:hypothetical protein
MTANSFKDLVNAQLTYCCDILTSKAKEYATEDRLHNFRIAAALENCSPIQALGGMMSKHTVSIYDMINSGDAYSTKLWTEKITDHINYLLLLLALVDDSHK